MTLPPVPGWQSIHPLIVHFPIVLLLIAPLFILIGAARKPDKGSPFLLVALILMGLGTVSIFAAASSGEAAGELSGNLPDVKAVLEQHEYLAKTTEIAFSALTLIFSAILFVPKLLKCQQSRAVSSVLPLVFLVLYATGTISLVNTAHQGGRLVHELGVTAPMHPRIGVVESAEKE